MEIMMLVGGIVLGCLSTQIIIRLNSGSGYFRIDPVELEDAEGMYNINVRINTRQNLLHKKRIILTREPR